MGGLHWPAPHSIHDTPATCLFNIGSFLTLLLLLLLLLPLMICVPCAPAGSPGYDPSTLLIPPAALASMSEFMRQFWGLKARAMDIVLFVRHGR